MLRRSLVPNSFVDMAVMLFVVAAIPIVFWFEVFVVLPYYFDQWTVTYMFHILLGTFCLINITGNYMYLMLYDTSIRGRILPVTNDPNWKFCTICESLTPPRSFHCNSCNICILKRDHHCIYSGCCIGYFNQRYFLMFVLYIFLSTLYMLGFNLCFMWKELNHDSVLSLVASVVLPLAMLAWDVSMRQVCILLCILITITCALTGVLFYYHTNLLLKGAVVFEYNKRIKDYDLGRRENVRQTLGERWKLVWLWPFIESQLPGDGINWNVKEIVKNK